MADPVRAASVGIGWWSNELADAAEKSENITIVSCYTRSEEKRRAFSKRYRCREAASYEEILEDPEVEAVILTTPDSLHADQVVAAAGRGKHVFVEKPYARSVKDCLRATEACRRAGVTLAVGHNRRRQASARKIKELLEGGELGQPIQVEANFSSFSVQNPDYSSWRVVPSDSAIGPLSGMGIHHMETFQYLLGPVKRVASFSRNLYTPAKHHDVTASILEFQSGALGYLGVGWVVARVFFLNLHGTRASVFSEVDGTRVFLQKVGSMEKVPLELPQVDTLFEEVDEFARSIRKGTRPEVSGEEGTAAVAVMEAIIASAREGKTVEVERFLAPEEA